MARVKRPSLALTLSSAAYIATGYLVTVGLARMFGPAEFGTYAVVTAVMTIANLLVSRGVPVAASREIARHPGSVRATMRVASRATMRSAVIVTLATCIAALPLGIALGRDVVPLLVVGSLASITFAVQALVIAPLNGLHWFTWQATTRTTYSLARVALIVGGAAVAGLPGAVVGYVVAPLVASIPALLGSMRRSMDAAERGALDETLQTPAPVVTSRALVRAATPLLLTSVWVALLLTIDLVALRAVGSDHETGLYGAAGTLAHVPFYLIAALPMETLPRVAALELADARRAMATRLLDHALYMLALPTILLATWGPPVFDLVFGARFDGGGDLVAPLALATAAVTIHSVLVAVDGATGRMRAAVVLGAATTAAMAAVVAVAGSTGGAVAAAWCAAATAGALAAAHWLVAHANARVAGPRPSAIVLTASYVVFALASTWVAPSLLEGIGVAAAVTATILLWRSQFAAPHAAPATVS